MTSSLRRTDPSKTEASSRRMGALGKVILPFAKAWHGSRGWSNSHATADGHYGRS